MYTTWQDYLNGTFRQSITCSVNALIMYTLAKDVDGLVWCFVLSP